MPPRLNQPARAPWVILLSLLAGSGWLLSQTYPSGLSFPFTGTIHFALITLSAIAIRRGWEPLPRRSLISILITGLCIFVLPSAAYEFASTAVTPSTTTALFCAIPVFTTVAAAVFAPGMTQRQLLWPSLAGLLGALLLFPSELPASLRSELLFAFLVASCIAIAIAAVRIHSVLQGVPLPQAVAIIALGASISLGVYGLSLGWPHISILILEVETFRCLAFDLPFVWLLTWLLRETDPICLSSRFLLTPLVTVLEGYAIIHILPDTRQLTAIVLITAGALVLLYKNDPEDTPSLHLR